MQPSVVLLTLLAAIAAAHNGLHGAQGATSSLKQQGASVNGLTQGAGVKGAPKSLKQGASGARTIPRIRGTQKLQARDPRKTKGKGNSKKVKGNSKKGQKGKKRQ